MLASSQLINNHDYNIRGIKTLKKSIHLTKYVLDKSISIGVVAIDKESIGNRLSSTSLRFEFFPTSR